MEVGVHEGLFIGRSGNVEMSCFRGGYSSESEGKEGFVCLAVIARIGRTRSRLVWGLPPTVSAAVRMI